MIEFLNRLVYNIFRDAHLPHEGSVFTLSKSAVVRKDSHLPTRGMKSATERTAHCRDERLPVVIFCGRFFVLNGDAHHERKNEVPYQDQSQNEKRNARRSRGHCAAQRRIDVLGGILANGARLCLRNLALAFGENQTNSGSQFARRSDLIIWQVIAWGSAYLDAKPGDVRSGGKRQQECIGARRSVSISAQKVNKSLNYQQAFSTGVRGFSTESLFAFGGIR